MKIKSIRMKLFLTLTAILTVIIALLILINNSVLESFYLYSKQKNLISAYNKINEYYNSNSDNKQIDIESEIEKVSINNDFDILIKENQDIIIYTTNKDFSSNITQRKMVDILQSDDKNLYSDGNVNIKKSPDLKNGLTYIMLSAKLDNGYNLYIRVAVNSIRESVKIANDFFCLIGGVIIIISGVVVSLVSAKFTKPISELSDIAVRMSKLDFSKKYNEKYDDDEIDKLGNSINLMSEKLEKTINRLRESNSELERDIEEKSKIDEMRKQFISDVSHELKTPISLIQGYAEGLQEGIPKDEESRKFYAEVILDEANKMDNLVKRLLELMKLEYGELEFENKEFNITELISEVIRKHKKILDEKDITVIFDNNQAIKVVADAFYIEQVVTNYFSNAVKNVKRIDGKKEIKIEIEQGENIIVKVFNTGEKINEDNINKIWRRFYKADESRNRNDGGTGIGLSIVKAIMNNYNKKYGVKNKENGVEFYFELEKGI